MFYRPEDTAPRNGGLPHNPFKAIIAPRPIGWISTRGSSGDNLAPYSFFNAVSDRPPQIVFAGTRKDSLRNIEETGVFAHSMVSQSLWHAMNETSAHFALGQDEFQKAQVAKAECLTINCPRVAAAPATLECRLDRVVTLASGVDFLVIGTVTGVHIDDACLTEGRFDLTKARPMARLGYFDYAVVTETLPLARPD